MPDNMAFHELRGGDIFREHTFREAIVLLRGGTTNWEYAKTCAMIALAMKANHLPVHDAAFLLGYLDEGDMNLIRLSEEGLDNVDGDLDPTDEDILAVAQWLAECVCNF